MNIKTSKLLTLALAGIALNFVVSQVSFAAESFSDVKYKTVTVEGQEVFYREAGDPNAPTILLLHGFPTSSHMFRELIPELADRFHLVAPDYPGFGQSSMPAVDEFEYTFDNLSNVVSKFIDTVGLKHYSLYLMDYGAPIGFRIATQNPERVDSLIIQNGNAYVEGINNNFWEPIQAYWKDRDAVNKGLDNDWWKNIKAALNKPNMTNDEALRFLVTEGATKWQYTNGVRNIENISPDTWNHVQPLLDREGNTEIQLQLFYSYGSNPSLYPQWQTYLREHQPPTLIVWGDKDEIFPAEGAHPYKRDLKNVDFHLLNTGHFALEEDVDVIAAHIKRFLNDKKVALNLPK